MTTPKARQTRGELLEAARRIILRLGIERLSMDRVAEESGMSKGAVTYHFKTKRMLLAALLEEYAEHLEARLRESEALFSGAPEATFFPGYVEWFRAFDRDHAGWAQIGIALLNQNFHDPELLEPVRRWYARTAERMRRMPESKRTAALLAFMALEGLFYTTKFGLNPLDGEEKRRIFGEIAAAFPGIRRDEGEEKGAS